jgi:hypothetical protein
VGKRFNGRRKSDACVYLAVRRHTGAEQWLNGTCSGLLCNWRVLRISTASGNSPTSRSAPLHLPPIPDNAQALSPSPRLALRRFPCLTPSHTLILLLLPPLPSRRPDRPTATSMQPRIRASGSDCPRLQESGELGTWRSTFESNSTARHAAEARQGR